MKSENWDRLWFESYDEMERFLHHLLEDLGHELTYEISSPINGVNDVYLTIYWEV